MINRDKEIFNPIKDWRQKWKQLVILQKIVAKYPVY